ncbi:hypothetical protein [Halorubrum salinum]|uniref:hypothetical protein n=1 Tax=Halorubrum salinum TaxID=767517 RepID=UPI0021117F85|nr:hypothetical protein [Halorubrum salinum]
MSSSGSDWVGRAKGTSIDEGLMRAIVAPILALGSGVALLIENGLASLSGLFAVFGDVRRFIGALFTEPITALELASQATGVSSQQFGVLAAPVVMASIALGLVLVDLIWGGEIPIVSALNPFS